MDMTGRAVLVTGASSGLGRATAILLSRLGARVLLIARNVERLKETYDALDGNGHAFCSFDLNETDKIVQLIADHAAQFSPFSGLVHAAGVYLVKPLRVCRPQDFDALYRINVVAASQLLRGLTAKRGVVASNGCSAVVVASVMSVVGDVGLSAYAASKAAIMGLVRTSALELAKENIRVNAVLPGTFDSGITQNSMSALLPEHIDAIHRMHPLGTGRAEDVANAVAFLLADTGRWITGSCLAVDGGYTAH